MPRATALDSPSHIKLPAGRCSNLSDARRYPQLYNGFGLFRSLKLTEASGMLGPHFYESRPIKLGVLTLGAITGLSTGGPEGTSRECR